MEETVQEEGMGGEWRGSEEGLWGEGEEGLEKRELLGGNLMGLGRAVRSRSRDVGIIENVK